MLYVLSSGPGCWVINHVPDEWSETACDVKDILYTPLRWAWRSSPTVARVLGWYYELWGMPVQREEGYQPKSL